MTGLTRPHLLAGLLIAAIATLAVIAGCEPTCDSIPTQAFAHLRIVNDVPDAPVISVIVDHDSTRVFDSLFYDISRYTPSYNRRRALNYQTKYIKGTGSLAAGTHSFTFLDQDGNVIPVYDPKTGQTSNSTSLAISDKDETLVVAGLEHGNESQAVRLFHLHDQLRRSDTGSSLLRFVQGVPDVQQGIDLYFVKGGVNFSNPNLSLAFGQITDGNGKGNGTGNSASDYYPVRNADSTLITVSGDTTLAGRIVLIPYPLSTHGLFGTIIIRGRGAATDGQQNISLLFLPDGPEFAGTPQIDYHFYEVRFANATRLDSLCLLIRHAIKEPNVRNNVPQQPVVFGIQTDSISQYWRLTTDYHDTVVFVAARTRNDIVGIDSLAGRQHADERLTLIEMETNPLGSPSGYQLMRLEDTLATPKSSSFGRVRFVNASPDHPSITIGSATLGARGSIKTVDLPIGTQSLAVSDGTNSTTISISINNDTPITVIFGAATASNNFPYTIAIK